MTGLYVHIPFCLRKCHYCNYIIKVDASEQDRLDYFSAIEKELEFASAPYGVIGLDCALPLYIKALIETETIDFSKMIAMMTIAGAQLVRLEDRIGHLSVGADADVTVIDPGESWTIDAGEFKSKARNCPFDGWKVTGRAVATIVGGRIKYQRDRERSKSSPGAPGKDGGEQELKLNV